MYVWLVRHGEVDYASDPHPGRFPGPGLTERGHAQAASLVERVGRLEWDKIFCSDLLRARQTIEPCRVRLGLEVEYDARLREVSESLFDRSLECSSEEPVARQLNRLERFTQDLYALRCARVLVVAHLRVIRYVSSAFGAPVEDARSGSVYLMQSD